ncbi:hypothetical protein Pmar_PMAR010070 [Perkinsus marinus ATCC 50983]|uniref:Mon2 C-terminal domain-containing protein n=1 Tax=Perkinsus marinus (strain ATCC 50983 / TXsc) TaxID=423536 RepID=C5K4R3_PERM5|nr:hypothetical protein Pmar_PMAR010070 [Perkinsus marinus ATCC 50983]EER20335.1 hypothetical protein Pmar_PMAR010070 [Perkinsus marinus ATCC 50983]|eukprot:XP_002788539.1 hypothetical protein Pmar_PMAR010070 [Perkinsus marinus ATCC 50983]
MNDSDSSPASAAPTGRRDLPTDPKSNRFVELVNSLSHVLHHLWFASVPTPLDTTDSRMMKMSTLLEDADLSTPTTGSDLLTLGVSHVFAGEGRVSLLDCLADSDPPSSVNPSFGAALAADTILLLVDHIESRDMLACSWAPLLSSLSLLLSVRLPRSRSQMSDETTMMTDDDEAFDIFLQSVLSALERLLLQCSKYPQLSSGRDSCLEALAKESLPRKDALRLDCHTATCAKGFLNICHRSGERLSVPGWTLALKTFETLCLRFISPEQQSSAANSDSGLECQMLAVSMDSLFSTSPEADGSFVDMVDALVHRDTCWSLERLAMALTSAEPRRLDLVLTTIVTPALETSIHPEEAAVCIGKVLVGHISNQGCCVKGLIEPLKAFTTSAPETVVSILKDLMVHSPVATKLDTEGWVCLSELVRDLCDVPTVVAASQASSIGKRSSQLMVNQLHLSVYSLLEVLVMECIDVLPNSSLALLIDGLQRLSTNSVINTSLKALGLLWNVSDALMSRMSGGRGGGVSDHSRRHYSTGSSTGDGNPANAEPITFDPQESGRLWFDLLTKFKSASLDPRPAVRHCAIRTMVSMLNAACGCPEVHAASAVGVMCDTLAEVVAASTTATTLNGSQEDDRSNRGSSEGLIVHHSRDSVQKQWSETCVLVLEGSVSIASKYHTLMTAEEFDTPSLAILDFIQPRLAGREGEVHAACANALVELLRLGATDKDTKLWSRGWQLVAYIADTLVEESLTSEEPSVLLPLNLAELIKEPQSLAAFRCDDVIVLALLVMATVTRPSTYLQSALPFKDVWIPTMLSDPTKRGAAASSAGRNGVSAGLCEVASRGRCAQLLWGKTGSSASWEARYRRLPEALKGPVVEARARDESCDECHQPSSTKAILFSRTAQRLPHKFMELWSVLDLVATSDVPEGSLEVLVQLLCNAFLDPQYCLRDSLTAALAVRAGNTCEIIARKLSLSSEVKSVVLEATTSAAIDLLRTYYAGGTGGGQSWKASGLWELAAEMVSTSLDGLSFQGTTAEELQPFWSDCVEELCKKLPSVLQIHYRYSHQRAVSGPVDGNREADYKADWATVSAVAVLIALCRSKFADPTKVVELTSKLCDTKARGGGDLGRCALRVLFAVASPSGMLWSSEDIKATSIKVAERWVGHRYTTEGHLNATTPSSPTDYGARDAGMEISSQLRMLGTSELCRRICCTLSQYAEDEQATTDDPMAHHRTEQVLFVLGRLCDVADEQLLLATLPALSKLVATTKDERVRRGVPRVMLTLGEVMGSKAAYKQLVGSDFV